MLTITEKEQQQISPGAGADPFYQSEETETETETGLQELPPERQVKILGNTPNNIANGGKLAFDGADMLFDYPGTDYGLTSVYGSGDAVFLDNERGAYKCISVVGDKIYYIRDRRAYYINRDGTGKRAIPELTDYENISRLYVSDKYYYVYLYDDRLYCIERGTGTAVYDNGSVSGIFAGDECRFTFLLNCKPRCSFVSRDATL